MSGSGDILIRGMKMPKNCAECFFHKVFPATGVGINQIYCALCGINIVKLSDAQPDCPLVPVPPHGRLIDADELKAKQQEDADLFINAVSLAEKSRRDEALNAVANIVNAPTIIPAEEGE